MNAIESMLAKYDCKNIVDYRNALKEIIQEVALVPPISGVPNNEILKIKFEVDTNPPAGASFQNKYALLPSPYAARLYDEPSLFAGKLHAVLCRAWQNRVKGRDFYDYVWYLSRGIKVNINHLQKRLEQSGHWNEIGGDLTIAKLKQMLCERFECIDFNDAKNDVSKFIGDQHKLDLWSPEFFTSITNDRLE